EVFAMPSAFANPQHAPGHRLHGLQQRVVARFVLLAAGCFLAIFCHAIQLLDAMLQIVQAITPMTKASRHSAVLRFLRRCSGVMVLLISLPGVFQRCGTARATAQTIPGRWHLPTV